MRFFTITVITESVNIETKEILNSRDINIFQLNQPFETDRIGTNVKYRRTK